MFGKNSTKVQQACALDNKRINQVFAPLWIVVGVVVIIESRNLEYMSAYGPGPGSLPSLVRVADRYAGL